MKMKAYKLMEAWTNSVSAKREIYNLNHKSVSETVVESFPGANDAVYWARKGGYELSYVSLKDFIWQVDLRTVRKYLSVSSLYVRGWGGTRDVQELNSELKLSGDV